MHSTQKSKLIPILETIFAVIIWGGTFIATKIVLLEVSPAAIAEKDEL